MMSSYHHTTQPDKLAFRVQEASFNVYKPINQARLYEQIVAQIQERYMTGELRPGDKLPAERELAEQFTVSRTAVREAVKALQEKGLVEVKAGKGTFIADVTSSTTDVVRDSLGLVLLSQLEKGMADLIQVRAILEPEIAAIAATMATEDDFEAMQQAVDTMDGALDKADVFIEADLDYHLALAKATQNALIPILIDPVVGLLRQQRVRIFQVEGGAERGQYHHKRILETVKQRNPVAARRAMAEHLQQVVRDTSAATKQEN